MILVNGVETGQIDVMDRGLQYGDGLFETMAVINGQTEFWQPHMERLQLGCRRLSIPVPDESMLRGEAQQLIAAHPMDRQVLKVTITRGSGGRGYRPPENPQPTRILSLSPWPDYPAEYYTGGVRAYLCRTRLGANPALAGVKHLNRLEQVVARSEWSDPGIAEGVMMDGEDHLVEGTMSNLFFVMNGEIHTPDLSQCGVSGVVRQILIECLQQEGIPVHIRPIALGELETMEEAFCSNSLIEIWPIRKIGESAFPAPGAMTTHCIQLLNRPS